MARVVVALCLAHAAIVGDALGFCAIVYGDEEKCREATAARMSRVMTF